MDTNETVGEKMLRRTVLGGIGGLGVLSLSGASLAAALESDDERPEMDPYTYHTYQSIVDATIPETPELADELGPEHEPGGLDVDLEALLIGAFNNSQEIRTDGDLSFLTIRELEVDVDEDDLESLIDDVFDRHSYRDRYRLRKAGFRETGAVFGALRGASIEIEEDEETGGGLATYVVETLDTTAEGVSPNYPAAPLFAIAFDLVALHFVATEGRVDDLQESAFPAGGVFTRLSRNDRLRALETVLEDDVVDTLSDSLSAILPAPEALTETVTSVHLAASFGYYSEWAGYGETKVAPPSQRRLAMGVDEVQSRQQTGYPGPAAGYADLRGFEVSEFQENDY